MTRSRLLAAALAAMLAAAPSVASAQDARGRDRSPDRRADRAVPRGSVRPAPRDRGEARPYRPYRPGARRYSGYGYYGYPFSYGYPYYSRYPRFYGSFAYGYPYRYGYSWYGYGPYPYPYSYSYPYPGYVGVVPGPAYGAVRIDLPERDAEVYVDGYYVGTVDDFDGALQHLKLEPGAHRLEIQLEGFEPASFDVQIEPGRTITYRTRLRPLAP